MCRLQRLVSPVTVNAADHTYDSSGFQNRRTWNDPSNHELNPGLLIISSRETRKFVDNPQHIRGGLSRHPMSYHHMLRSATFNESMDSLSCDFRPSMQVYQSQISRFPAFSDSSEMGPSRSSG